MKILITSDLYTTATNGVVTSIKNLCEELIKKGHDVRILTLSETSHSRKEGIIYYIRSMPLPVYPNVRMPLTYRHNLIKELVEWQPDVIHSQCEFFSLEFAKYIARKTDAPIVHTYHTLYEQYFAYIMPVRSFGDYVVRVQSRRRLRRVKTIIAPTHKVEQTLRGYGIKNNISVIPSGISLDQHKEHISAEERAQKRDELGISEDKLLLVNLGRLGTEKNIDELISFYARALEKREDIMFMIVGGGPAKESLEELAKKLGVADKVIFTGMVEPTEVHKYYQLGDLFVSASTSETQGLTYVEAAASGLPLLCRDDPCLEGVIYQGENGYKYTNETEFIEYLDKIADDKEWRNGAGERSREIAEQFDKAHFGDAVESVYKALVK